MTVDYGTAIPVVVPDSTTVQYATLTKSYRGGWRSDTVDVVQGVYSDYGYSSGLSWNYGCMWFGNLRSVLSGMSVKSATLTLYRKTGSGSSSAKTLYLCAITNTTARRRAVHRGKLRGHRHHWPRAAGDVRHSACRGAGAGERNVRRPVPVRVALQLWLRQLVELLYAHGRNGQYLQALSASGLQQRRHSRRVRRFPMCHRNSLRGAGENAHPLLFLFWQNGYRKRPTTSPGRLSDDAGDGGAGACLPGRGIA